GCESRDSGDCVSAPGATFTHPVTANIYAVADCAGSPCPGALLATATQTLTLPFRPSADAVNCTGANAGKWFNTVTSLCQSSISSVQTFAFASGAVPADRMVIWTVAFNTS